MLRTLVFYEVNRPTHTLRTVCENSKDVRAIRQMMYSPEGVWKFLKAYSG